jgi:hypothetical protein
MPKAFSHTSSVSVPLGYCAYILDSGMIKGPLVWWGNLSSWREDYEAKGYPQEKWKMLSYLYLVLVLPRAHNAGQRVGSNWIWLQESSGICTWNWQDWSPYTEGLSGTNTESAYPANSRCRNNVNSPVRTSAIGLLQHLRLLYLPSELDITKYTYNEFTYHLIAIKPQTLWY